jgi:putative hydrolase of the HAD superfamily
MRAVHIPLSVIPAEQKGTDEGAPDGVIHALADLPGLLAAW